MSNFSRFISSLSAPVSVGESNESTTSMTLTSPTFDDVKMRLEEKGLKVKWYKDLFIVTYPKRGSKKSESVDYTDNLVKECRGLIVNKNSPFNVVCKGYDMFENNIPGDLDLKNTRITTTIDGTYIRLYYNVASEKWCVATNRCIDAKKARWQSYKTFYDYFNEASRSPDSLLDYDKLNKDCVYLFVVCHPENRIVRVYTSAMLYHIGTIDKTKNWSSVDEDIGIPKPPVMDLEKTMIKDVAQLQDYTGTLDWQTPGFVVEWTEGEIVKRYKFRNPKYERVNGLRGDNVSMVEHYLKLREDTDNPQRFVEFVKYFPEYSVIEDSINMVAKYIHQNYMSYYVNKTIQYVPDIISWRILCELHTRFIRTKEATTLDIVQNVIRSMQPSELAKLLRF